MTLRQHLSQIRLAPGRRFRAWGNGLTASAILLACQSTGDGQEAEKLAPTSPALVEEKPPKAEAASRRFKIRTEGSEVLFEMDAPFERIYGEALNAMMGELQLDLSDLRRSTGLIDVDLDRLVLYQAKRDSEEDAFGERSKSDLQNEHARAWLEIGADAPPRKRAEYRRVQFKLNRLEVIGSGSTQVTEQTPLTRVRVTGDFRLHGRTSQKQAELELRFGFVKGSLESVSIRTLKPFQVRLDEHDVRPRESFGVLAQKTLSALAPKVASQADVSLKLQLSP